MEKIHELKKMLCKELDEYARKGDITANSLDVIDKLAHTIKNLDKIIEYSESEEGGYSGWYLPHRGYAYADEDTGGSSMRGSSYARGRMGAKRDSMGRYSREDGYSYHDGMEDIVSDLRSMSASFPDEKRRKVERLISEIER